MACTTLLVGREATNDGSTLIARNEDCENGTFNLKSMVVVQPADQPRTYTGVNSHLTIELPDDPLRYTCTPNTERKDGVWGEAGINAANVAMTATETISTNARVLGADPLVAYDAATGAPGGIGEEDLVTIVLPYIHSAKEGVQRMGQLLERYGTYETNGVAFSDQSDIWYIETVGGHHWIARRVPDDCFVAQPNRLGIDHFDLADAFGAQHDFMCSADLPQWMAANHLDVTLPPNGNDGPTMEGVPVQFNPRQAFGSYTWLDIVYNNPRAWYMIKNLIGDDEGFVGCAPKFTAESMDLPWCARPKVKLSVMDVKSMLSSTYEGTPFDCYGLQGTEESRHRFRDIGINRTCECSVLQIRPQAAKAARAVQWVSFGSGPFNSSIALFTNVDALPKYLDTPAEVSTDSFYWVDRLVAALADPEYFDNMEAISSYQQTTLADGYAALRQVDGRLAQMAADMGVGVDALDEGEAETVLAESNKALVEKVQKANGQLLASVLFTRSLNMRNAFGSNDH